MYLLLLYYTFINQSLQFVCVCVCDYSCLGDENKRTIFKQAKVCSCLCC